MVDLHAFGLHTDPQNWGTLQEFSARSFGLNTQSSNECAGSVSDDRNRLNLCERCILVSIRSPSQFKMRLPLDCWSKGGFMQDSGQWTSQRASLPSGVRHGQQPHWCNILPTPSRSSLQLRWPLPHGQEQLAQGSSPRPLPLKPATWYDAVLVSLCHNY